MSDATPPPPNYRLEGMEQVVKEVLLQIQARGTEPELPTGLARLDDAIWGLHRTEVTVIAARPGEGKTSIALQIAGHLASLKKRVLFLSLEMNVHQIVERWLIQLTQADAWKLRTGQGSAEFVKKVEAMDGYFKALNLRCLDDQGITVSEITNLLNEMAKTDAPPDLVVIDFIQLIEAEEDGVSDMEAIKHYLRSLKRLAKRYNLAVIVCSQINREGGKSAKMAPKLIHLKGSGAIEELADCVLMLWWQELGTEEEPEGTRYWVCVEKQRYGPPGQKVPIQFDKEHLTFLAAEHPVLEWSDDQVPTPREPGEDG
jgi:replicative DNA helicase